MRRWASRRRSAYTRLAQKRRRVASLKLGLLERDEKGWADTRGNADDRLEGPLDGSHEALEYGTRLKLDLLKGDEEGCAKRRGDADPKDAEVEGRVD